MTSRVGAMTSRCQLALMLALGVATLLAVATCGSSEASKRFDCSVFCKSTGFSGVVGGCRCSFTLFTSKRAYMPGPHHGWRGSGGSDGLSRLRHLFSSRPPHRTDHQETPQDRQLAGLDSRRFGNGYK